MCVNLKAILRIFSSSVSILRILICFFLCLCFVIFFRLPFVYFFVSVPYFASVFAFVLSFFFLLPFSSVFVCSLCIHFTFLPSSFPSSLLCQSYLRPCVFACGPDENKHGEVNGGSPTKAANKHQESSFQRANKHTTKPKQTKKKETPTNAKH